MRLLKKEKNASTLELHLLMSYNYIFSSQLLICGFRVSHCSCVTHSLPLLRENAFLCCYFYVSLSVFTLNFWSVLGRVYRRGHNISENRGGAGGAGVLLTIECFV